VRPAVKRVAPDLQQQPKAAAWRPFFARLIYNQEPGLEHEFYEDEQEY